MASQRPHTAQPQPWITSAGQKPGALQGVS